MTNSIKFKRIMAYCIDLLIISILVSLLSNINFLNPQREKYQKVAAEYNYYADEMRESLGNTSKIEFNSIINDEYIAYMYDLQYYGMSYTIIEIVTVLLYFTLFPKFNHNQTIGKRLLKIKVVNSDNSEKVSIWKFLARGALIPIFTNIILYNTITSIINFGIMFVFKPKMYLYANIIITLVFCAFCYADIIFMLANKNELSLHDKITRTKVIEKC